MSDSSPLDATIGRNDARNDNSVSADVSDAVTPRLDSQVDAVVDARVPDFVVDAGRIDFGTIDAGPRMPSVTVAPGDPGLTYEGRWGQGDPAICDASGCAIRFLVAADEIYATFTDTRMTRPGKIAVFVDGVRRDTLMLAEGMHEVQLASGLAAGMHEIGVVKATEPLRGRISFHGLRLSNATRPLPAPRTRRIEFVGDSVTCGGGNIGPNPCGSGNEGDATWYEDSAQAFPTFAANTLNAALSVVAESGIGVTDAAGGMRLSRLYTRTVAYPMGWNSVDSETGVVAWTFAQPSDAVVVNLGTNDRDIGNYQAAYRIFVDRIRQRNPNSHIFMMVGGIVGGDPNMSNAPAGTAAWMLRFYQTLIDERAQQGDARWHKIYHSMQPSNELRCGHPAVAFHQQMAATVTTELRTALGW